jgi:hypothetical protein
MLKYNIANSQESENSPGTPYKPFIERKEQYKGSKVKERAEWQLNGLEGAQKEEKSRGLKSKNKARRKLRAPMPSTSTSSSSICEGRAETFEDGWIHSRSCLEWWHEDCSSWEGSGSFLCACALLHSTLRTLVRPGVKERAFCQLFSKHYCKDYVCFLSIVMSDISSQQMDVDETWHVL